jgi:protein-disulfide isomerase
MNKTKTIMFTVWMLAFYLSWGAVDALGATTTYQRCLAPGPAVKIELDSRLCAGDENAPIVLALYACGRSEPCAKLIPSLYSEILSGRLKGKVRLCIRPFFPRQEENATACGRALVAAASQGMFWPYLFQLYSHYDSYKLCLLKKWADVKGLDRDAFEVAYNHTTTTETLAASRREGIANKVDKVPTAFINGRTVQCEISVSTLQDLLEEEYDRVAKVN